MNISELLKCAVFAEKWKAMGSAVKKPAENLLEKGKQVMNLKTQPKVELNNLVRPTERTATASLQDTTLIMKLEALSKRGRINNIQADSSGMTLPTDGGFSVGGANKIAASIRDLMKLTGPKTRVILKRNFPK